MHHYDKPRRIPFERLVVSPPDPPAILVLVRHSNILGGLSLFHPLSESRGLPHIGVFPHNRVQPSDLAFSCPLRKSGVCQRLLAHQAVSVPTQKSKCIKLSQDFRKAFASKDLWLVTVCNLIRRQTWVLRKDCANSGVCQPCSEKISDWLILVASVGRSAYSTADEHRQVNFP